jgi:hypothetical protein
MAYENKRLYNGTLTETSASLYTVPDGYEAIIKTISICNKTATATTVTLKLGSVYLCYQYPIDAYDTIILSPTDHILAAAEILAGNAGAASAIDLIISGRVESV